MVNKQKTQPQGQAAQLSNQERAYIAASRRKDRDIASRMRSAHMASCIHRQKTGKSLRITEEAVRDDEMYVEEEELPVSYRLLTQFDGQPAIQASSLQRSGLSSSRAVLSARLNQADRQWRESDGISRLFAQTFPNLAGQARQLSSLPPARQQPGMQPDLQPPPQQMPVNAAPQMLLRPRQFDAQLQMTVPRLNQVSSAGGLHLPGQATVGDLQPAEQMQASDFAQGPDQWPWLHQELAHEPAQALDRMPAFDTVPAFDLVPALGQTLAMGPRSGLGQRAGQHQTPAMGSMPAFNQAQVFDPMQPAYPVHQADPTPAGYAMRSGGQMQFGGGAPQAGDIVASSWEIQPAGGPDFLDQGPLALVQQPWPTAQAGPSDLGEGGNPDITFSSSYDAFSPFALETF